MKYLLTEPLVLCGPTPWCVRLEDASRLDRRFWNVARFDDATLGSETAIAHALLTVHGTRFVTTVERIAAIAADRATTPSHRIAAIEDLAKSLLQQFEDECEVQVDGYMRFQRQRGESEAFLP